MLIRFSFVVLVFLLGISCTPRKVSEKEPDARELLKKKPAGMEYKERVKEVVFENLQMIGRVKITGVHGDRLHGMLLRTLRFQNISRQVEKKYDLPKNLLLAMIMQESGGADLLPNSSDDGGLGLCHMQPITAAAFGLKIYQNCTALRSYKHGAALRQLIKTHKYDRRELVKYDDRFHPILNIDAAGRMIAYYMSGKQYKSTPLRTAIYAYAGRKNYALYYKSISNYMEKLNDAKTIKAVERKFNRLNKNLKIKGKKAGFKEYIKTHQEVLKNYGLDNYK